MRNRKSDVIIAVVAGLGAAVIGNALELLLDRSLAPMTGSVVGAFVALIVYWGRGILRSTA